MEQLIMRWKNDGSPAVLPQMPADITYRPITEVENGIDIWLDIVRYGLTDSLLDHEYYKGVMEDFGEYPYDPRFNFIFFVGGEPAATTAVLFDSKTKDGYIHMVACKDTFRGRGIGNLMNELSVYTLKQQGCQTAHLTTDDWRIPAIKSYLRAKFMPDESTEDFRERWKKIYEIIEKKD